MDDKIVYEGWLKVYKREAQGKTYDILKDYDAVSAIIVNEYDEILLVRQYRPALMEDTLEIPAGTMDKIEENEAQCLLRELREEAGLNIEPEAVRHIISYKPMVGFSNSLMKVFYINILKKDLKIGRLEDEDVYEAIWMGFEELGEKIAKGEILDVKTILSYLYVNCNQPLR